VSDVNQAAADEVARKVNEAGRKSLSVQTDVRVPSECQTLVNTTLKELDRIDILVCSAGVGGFAVQGDSGKPAILENITEKEWDLTIDVNLKGVFLCNQAVTPYFREQKRINTDVLISDVIDLHELEEKGFKKLLDSQDVVKILVKP